MGIYSDILLTVDFDRTLTAPDSTIPERNIEAIRHFIENGGAFTVNTGRSVPMIRVIAENVPLNAPLLLYNGSAAYDVKTKSFAFAHAIGMDMESTLAEVARQFPDMVLELQGVDAHYCYGKNEMWEAFSRKQNCPFAYLGEGVDPGPFLKFALYGQIRENSMSHLYEGSSEEIARMDVVQRQLEEKWGDQCAIFRAAPRIIDVQVKGVSKLRAARQLQQQLGKKLLVCVGDGENDVTMLKGAEYAYCPADGVVADRFENVCKCADGAVADVIYKKIPKILENKP